MQIVKLGCVKKSLGIQILVAEKLIKVAVKFVFTGFRHDVDHRAGIASVFRVKRVCEHAKLRDAVWRRLNGGKICKLVVAVASVHGKVIISPAAAVHTHDTRTVATI